MNRLLSVLALGLFSFATIFAINSPVNYDLPTMVNFTAENENFTTLRTTVKPPDLAVILNSKML